MNIESNSWQSVKDVPPPRDVVLETKIDDERGVRNVTPLKAVGNMWWFPDMEMYPYYVPTHWRPIVPSVT